jgi:DHA3 family macrolide efflux protein-like MFS transporter
VWWLTQETGSATVLATATLVAVLPQVTVGPFAGALIDRWNRRRVILVADGTIALVSALLAYLFWTGQVQVWHIFFVKVVRGLGGAFHWPAMAASTTLMVPTEHLSRVAGLNQTMQGAMTIIAPPLGALLLAVLPIHGILGLDVFTAGLAIAPLLVLTIPQPQRSVDEARQPYFSQLRAGLRYVWGWRGLFILLVMVTVLNGLLSPAFSLMPLLVTEHFGRGALELSWLNSAAGVGVIAGGLILSVWGGFRRRIFTSLSGLLGMGIAVSALGVLPPWGLLVAVGAMAVAGAMQPMVNGPLMALFQSAVAPEMQGRVFSLISSLAAAMSPLGLAIAGPVADRMGIQLWYILGGIGLIAMGVAGFLVPAVARLEDHAAARAPAATGSPPP